MLFNSCIIIPIYNHLEFADILKELTQHLPVILIDDGSNKEYEQKIHQLAEEHERVTLIRHKNNKGKGGAVMTGLNVAHDKGFSHALQIDADGQHNINDIHPLLALSQENPTALVSGWPIYDSIPFGRYIARYITHFFVWLETFSFSIKDSMCGFRVYPIPSTIKLIQSHTFGTRMDFDIEIMVRLYWNNFPIRWLPTKITYPTDGTSHFRLWHDNWLISYMHFRLLFGALWHIPQLAFKGRVDNDNAN